MAGDDSGINYFFQTRNGISLLRNIDRIASALEVIALELKQTRESPTLKENPDGPTGEERRNEDRGAGHR